MRRPFGDCVCGAPKALHSTRAFESNFLLESGSKLADEQIDNYLPSVPQGTHGAEAATPGPKGLTSRHLNFSSSQLRPDKPAATPPPPRSASPRSASPRSASPRSASSRSSSPRRERSTSDSWTAGRAGGSDVGGSPAGSVDSAAGRASEEALNAVYRQCEQLRRERDAAVAALDFEARERQATEQSLRDSEVQLSLANGALNDSGDGCEGRRGGRGVERRRGEGVREEGCPGRREVTLLLLANHTHQPDSARDREADQPPH